MDNDDSLEEIRKLYPHLSDEELREAERNLERYLEVVLRIYESARRDAARSKKLDELLEKDKAAGE